MWLTYSLSYEFKKPIPEVVVAKISKHFFAALSLEECGSELARQ
jgi:hypothetical protein